MENGEECSSLRTEHMRRLWDEEEGGTSEGKKEDERS